MCQIINGQWWSVGVVWTKKNLWHVGTIVCFQPYGEDRAQCRFGVLSLWCCWSAPGLRFWATPLDRMKSLSLLCWSGCKAHLFRCFTPVCKKASPGPVHIPAPCSEYFYTWFCVFTVQYTKFITGAVVLYFWNWTIITTVAIVGIKYPATHTMWLRKILSIRLALVAEWGKLFTM